MLSCDYIYLILNANEPNIKGVFSKRTYISGSNMTEAMLIFPKKEKKFFLNKVFFKPFEYKLYNHLKKNHPSSIRNQTPVCAESEFFPQPKVACS